MYIKAEIKRVVAATDKCSCGTCVMVAGFSKPK